MTFQLPSICDSCAHRKENEDVCDAYPTGIPDRFALGGFPHFDPESDGGLVWSLRPEAEWRLTQYLAFWNQPDLITG